MSRAKERNLNLFGLHGTTFSFLFSLSAFLLSFLCNLNCLRPQLVDMTAHINTVRGKGHWWGGGCPLISSADFQSIASMFIVASNKSHAWLPIATEKRANRRRLSVCVCMCVCEKQYKRTNTDMYIKSQQLVIAVLTAQRFSFQFSTMTTSTWLRGV